MPMRFVALIGIGLSLLMPPAGAARQGEDPRRLAQAALTRDFFVGAWEAQLTEFDRKLRIIWTLWEDGRLAYHFGEGHDGPLVRGSGGTWQLVGTEIHEEWERGDGRRDRGRGTVERIDDNTIRLTIVDNGDPRYKGLARIYRRIGGPQLSMR